MLGSGRLSSLPYPVTLAHCGSTMVAKGYGESVNPHKSPTVGDLNAGPLPPGKYRTSDLDGLQTSTLLPHKNTYEISPLLCPATTLLPLYLGSVRVSKGGLTLNSQLNLEGELRDPRHPGRGPQCSPTVTTSSRIFALLSLLRSKLVKCHF